MIGASCSYSTAVSHLLDSIIHNGVDAVIGFTTSYHGASDSLNSALTSGFNAAYLPAGEPQALKDELKRY